MPVFCHISSNCFLSIKEEIIISGFKEIIFSKFGSFPGPPAPIIGRDVISFLPIAVLYSENFIDFLSIFSIPTNLFCKFMIVTSLKAPGPMTIILFGIVFILNSFELMSITFEKSSVDKIVIEIRKIFNVTPF